MEELDLDGMAALAWGDPSGVPVLALHGWLDNAASFIPLAPHLPGVRLVALELPGHGRSAHLPPLAHYHLHDAVFDLLRAADLLGWGRFSLLGHSLGAGMASLTAAAAPERIERLALIEGTAPLSRPTNAAAELLRRSVAELRGIEAGPRWMRDRERAVRARRAVGGIGEAAVRLLVERGIEQTPEGVRWRHDPRLQCASPAYLDEAQVHACLAAVEAPALLVLAESGLLLGRPTTAGRIERFKDLRVERLPGGHHLHMESPEAVAELLLPFLLP